MMDERDSTTIFTPSLADVWFRQEHGELNVVETFSTFLWVLILDCCTFGVSSGRPVQNSNDSYQFVLL